MSDNTCHMNCVRQGRCARGNRGYVSPAQPSYTDQAVASTRRAELGRHLPQPPQYAERLIVGVHETILAAERTPARLRIDHQ
jgi:hypothetical protein